MASARRVRKPDEATLAPPYVVDRALQEGGLVTELGDAKRAQCNPLTARRLAQRTERREALLLEKLPHRAGGEPQDNRVAQDDGHELAPRVESGTAEHHAGPDVSVDRREG